MGCIGPKGGQFADPIFPASAGGADHVCREELPNDVIYPPSWPEAHGMSVQEQRNRHYQRCMGIMGQPGATLSPSAESAQ
jgi:hypothetical protein